MRVLVTGGGTGGHIYPAVSLVNYIKEKHPEAEFLYVGTKKGLESKIVPDKGIPFKSIEIQGFKRSLSLENVKTVYKFVKGIAAAKKIIRDFQPDIVMGTGGYVCGPVVYAAHKLHIPTIIHEQNSVAGVTNKFLARYVDKIGIAFAEAAASFPEDKVVLVGNPRAQEVAGIETSDILSDYQLDPGKPTVLIFGGSRGALKINQAMTESLPLLADKPYQVLYGSGDVYFDTVQTALAALPAMPHVKIVPYIKNMERVMVNVDLVAGRAGATSLAEFTALGLPAVLIPSPNVTNDHQTKNAMSLVNKGAAVIIKDAELTGEKLVNAIDGIMADPKRRQQMAQASRKQGIADATDRLYQLVEELLA